MKYLPLLLLLLVTGCDWLPVVIDESITLASPVIIEAERTAPEVTPEVKPEVKAETPKPVVVKVSTITQYTIDSCGWCKSDQRDILPLWEKQGWKILPPVDETRSPRGLYPRYELRGADGSFRTHSGSLRNWK
jgi:hypothetical protein